MTLISIIVLSRALALSTTIPSAIPTKPSHTYQCSWRASRTLLPLRRVSLKVLRRTREAPSGFPSARSGDIFGNGQMLVVRTPKDCADPIGQLVGPQQAVGLDHLALAVDPSGLHRIEPRTLLG